MKARSILIALYGLSMALLPLAHRATDLRTPDLSAYTLPDGSTPVLCTPGKKSDTNTRHRSWVCDACRLTSAPGLVALPSALHTAGPWKIPKLISAVQVVPTARLWLSAARPRGPPFGLTVAPDFRLPARPSKPKHVLSLALHFSQHL